MESYGRQPSSVEDGTLNEKIKFKCHITSVFCLLYINQNAEKNDLHKTKMFFFSSYIKQKLKTFIENETFDISENEITQLHEYSEQLKVRKISTKVKIL